MVEQESEGVQCPCPRLNCKRHGDCEACRKHHHGSKNPPYCERRGGGKEKKA